MLSETGPGRVSDGALRAGAGTEGTSKSPAGQHAAFGWLAPGHSAEARAALGPAAQDSGIKASDVGLEPE